MNRSSPRPNPALVTERAARRLDRRVMLLLCAAYVLPGWFGRDPVKGDEIAAFGFMWGMAEGQLNWWATSIGGMAVAPAALTHWLGAVSISVFGGLVGPEFASRLPFAAALALCLALVWYATYELARTPDAQPVSFAFGGQAETTSYARTLADGAVLAFMATLGLILLGHEATAAPVQLLGACALLYGVSVASRRPRRAALVLAIAPWLLVWGGGPALLFAALVAAVALWMVPNRPARWLNLAVLLVSIVAACAARSAVPGAEGWWRIGLVRPDWAELPSLLAWFAWPVWPLALWSIWQWRRHLQSPHIGIPLVLTLAWLSLSWLGGFQQRSLLLVLPCLAVLASFALPTLRRAVAAFVDWFSLLFFTGSLVVIWVYWIAMQTTWLPTQARTVARLAPGFEASFRWTAFLLAALGLAVWLGVVRWRAARHPSVLWKSLLLASSGVIVCWLTLMTLWLPVLDHARSYRTIVTTLTREVPPDACVSAPTLNIGQRTALAFYTQRTSLGAHDAAAATNCRWRVTVTSVKRGLMADQAEPGWVRKQVLRRPGDRDELWVLDERRR